MRHVSLRCTGVFLSALCAACTHVSIPPVPGEPLVASLPFQAAGIEDGRAEFADRLSYELAQRGQDPAASRWLHHVSEATKPAKPAAVLPAGLRVLVIPGIFGDCVDDQSLPFSDGRYRERPKNYTEGYAHYRASLAPVRALVVPGRASSASNAALIADQLVAQAQDPDVRSIVLVAYSKGLPDTLLALEALRDGGRLPAKVKALVSVSGVVMGTPIADQLQSLYDALAARFAPLECSRSDGGEMASLTMRERLPWLSGRRVPTDIKLYSVVAYTERGAVAPALLPFHDALNSLDRKNDGQMIAGWTLLPGSKLLAEVKSDHWTYVLALSQHPNPLVRNLAAPDDFPREAFFHALVKSVASGIEPWR